MRRARLRTALLLGVAIVLAGNATAMPAFAATEPPVTVPVLVEPVNGSSVSGDVPISATSTAPSVQFSLDGVTFGTPVAVATGTAATTWSSWGAANASHIWTAADCNEIGCSATLSPPATVTLANTAPAVTSPVPGATTGTSVTLLADAPGGGLAFFVDGIVSGFDPTAPYSLSLAGPLSEGSHIVSVQECDTAQTSCDGPTSPAVNFVVKVLHPTITSVSPNPFSPYHDGRADTTSFHLKLGGQQHVSFSIRNSNNQLVRGPHDKGIVGAGTHTYRWDGKTNTGKIAGDGVFTIVVMTSATSGGATLAGTAQATVRVDDSPPNLTGITGNGFTFYPVVDRYLDQFRPKVTVNEGGGLWLEIYNNAGVKVREIAKPHASKGTFQFAWDGRTAGGSLVRAGTYRYFFKAQDRAGNRRISPNFHVNLRLEHIVAKAKKYSRVGAGASSVTSSNWGCTDYRTDISRFDGGLWLVNVCDESFDGFEAIIANYNFSVAAAVRYDSIHVESLGATNVAPEPIAAIIYNWTKRDWDGVGAVNLRSNATGWANYGTVPAAHHVSSGRVVKVSIGLPDTNPPEDYDMAGVIIVVHYSVLAR